MPGTDDLRERKNRLRREIRKAAAALPAEYRAEASRRIAEQVLAMESWQKAGAVMAYVSLPEEPDTRGLIREAVRAGKTVLLPRCVSRTEMKALPFSGWDELEPGYLGIPEPKIPPSGHAGTSWMTAVRYAFGTAAGAGRSIPEPDLILVPCVTASPDGKRLGHGAGYYDRFLAGRAAETVCLCFRALAREDIPTGPYDRRMGRVVTD